eukprot:9475701-Pyramimonas_sp.AAC.1
MKYNQHQQQSQQGLIRGVSSDVSAGEQFSARLTSSRRGLGGEGTSARCGNGCEPTCVSRLAQSFLPRPRQALTTRDTPAADRPATTAVVHTEGATRKWAAPMPARLIMIAPCATHPRGGTDI